MNYVLMYIYYIQYIILSVKQEFEINVCLYESNDGIQLRDPKGHDSWNELLDVIINAIGNLVIKARLYEVLLK